MRRGWVLLRVFDRPFHSNSRMGALFDIDTTIASSAMWFATRDNGFPVQTESTDQFARGQLIGVAVCTAFITVLFFLRFTVKYMSGTKMLLDDCKHCRSKPPLNLCKMLTLIVARDLYRRLGASLFHDHVRHRIGTGGFLY